MPVQPLFPDSIDEVTHWFDAKGPGMAARCPAQEVGTKCRVWRLMAAIPELDGSSPSLVLKQDFPLSAARLEVDSKFCLRYPHIEIDGHFCHGILPSLDDLTAPVEAVGRVLVRLNEFLSCCQSPGWVEAEFHRERKDYWSRYAAKSKAPQAYRTIELLLDVDINVDGVQEVGAVALANGGKALATSSCAEPEKLARSRGWAVGTIVRGAALVAQLPLVERWTPSTWPKSFQELNDLISQLSDTPRYLSSWYSSRRWPNKAPVFVALIQGTVVFGWRLLPSHVARMNSPVLVPVEVTRIDRQWSLSRDHQSDKLKSLTSKKVVVFGCGSLGSPVIELLARAGVGTIEVVDPETFDSENVARHLLGASSVGERKATAVCGRVESSVPGVQMHSFPESAMQWFSKASQRSAPDLVIDCTGEEMVRVATSRLRRSILKLAPVLMAWMEPSCAAAHTLLVAGEDEWPTSDPAETAVNIARWPDDLQVQLPGCGQGFHSYGMADTWRAAGLVAERALAVLNGASTPSGICSMVRNRAYFEQTSTLVEFNLDPPSGSGTESVTIVRELPKVHREI
ncbi:hypothetical protein PG1C_05150 [Rugosibacter aromaticivorans]|uniref:THIF-type NAD/FAD binding fold domain-containing protein n=2 Tax=Rugosibacter aromaticivorans TaxID=1565605 RepID=A0A0C5J8N8_9PROT|nr:hypothetical protein PG1C_05150 [Rugosibacter aromaticivorans]